MKTGLWIASAVLGSISAIFIYMNYRIWFHGLKWKPGDKHISGLPIIGGLLGFFALRLTRLADFPGPGWASYAWLPPLLDPGCYIVLLFLLPLELIRKRFVSDKE